MRRGAKPAKVKVEAKPPVARKSPRDEGSRVHDLEKRLAEALEQQTATAEILGIISSSPADAQPVFDAIALNALRLCDAKGAVVVRYDGELLHLVAHHNVNPEAIDRLKRQFPLAPDHHLPIGRAVLDGAVVHVPDLQAAVEISESVARQFGARSQVVIPLVHQGRAVGAIGISRPQLGPFSDRQIELLKTFAAQAVIAIENVRLFNETKESLDQQTATAEILRIISSSPTDVQPTFDAVVASAVRLCDGFFGIAFQYDGERLSIVAHHKYSPEALDVIRRDYPAAPSRNTMAGRAVLDRAVIHVPDILHDPHVSERSRVNARDLGYRTFLAVPMLREGTPIGVLNVSREDARAFTDREIELVRSFADQAVIAVENVRLFTELQEKNRALTQAHAQVTEALEQQTATSEILSVISGSPTDVQPVFDTIVSSVVRLCDGLFSALYQFDGELIHQVAQHNFTPEALEAAHRVYPARPNRASGPARAILECAIVHIPDVAVDTEYRHALSQAIGFRSGLFVPMLREGVPIGVIAVARAESRPFSDTQIELLKTFADQAVIAIENVRLFNELQTSNRELTAALDTQTATSDILRVISRSQTDVQPVFDAIVASAVRLLHGYYGMMTRVVDDRLERVAVTSATGAEDPAVRASFPQPLHGQSVHARAIRDRAPVNIADALTDPRVSEERRAIARAIGFRSLAVVPLLRYDEPLGSIAVTRRGSGGFTNDEIALLQTFADQAVIAIENVRMFTELKERNQEVEQKSRELAAASQHKSEFLANMSHELRTPLNAIIGFSEVLSERMFGELNEKQAEYLKDINASGTHLLSLINDILDLSKIEAGRMELELTDFDLLQAIDNALTLVRERAGRRGIALQQSVEEPLGEIKGDERKVKQVLLNLLSNAVKFTPDGGRVEVHARVVDGMAEISVTDTGVGIAVEDQEAIFEEFRQVGTAERKAEGTGLGLTLCRKFVELHGGRISVKSQVGAGSTFAFTIPVRHGE